MIRTPKSSPEVKALWPSLAHNRSQTAYGRLTSMLNLTDSEDPVQLAELGLYNISDE